jgi:hypothetical protein
MLYHVAMARSWQYSRYRRAIMQGVMWIVLGATVGLASLQARQHPAPAPLSLPMRGYDLGPWRVTVPSDWEASESGDGILDFREPGDEGDRELRVEQDVVNPLLTSGKYLAEKLDPLVLPKAMTIPMGGQQGMMVSVPMSGNVGGTSIYAATVLANGDAIAIRLRVFRTPLPEDIALAQTIASAILYEPMNRHMRQHPKDVQKPDRPQAPDDGD